MRLRRVVPYSSGIRRVRRGRGFAYLADDGSRVDDATAERIQALVIPPAWSKVWICSAPNGHIQAVGVDVAGRRQYLYHEQWRNDRDEEKFDRVLQLARELPRLRAQVHADLSQRGLSRDRVAAIAVDLLDRGVFRVGGEEYAEEHGTRGVATLLRSQVRLSGDQMSFDYIAKGGLRRRVQITDAALAGAIRAVRRVRSESGRLLIYREGDELRELHSADINARLQQLCSCQSSAKDFRTWNATVLAAAAFARHDPPTSERQAKRIEKAVMEEVSALLGNTPAIARNSYVDPRTTRAFRSGHTIAAALRRANKRRSPDAQREIIDAAVIRLLRRA